MAKTTCTITECTSRAEARGYCFKHYSQAKNAGEFCPTPECSHQGCTNKARAKGLCSPHYIDATQRPCTIEGCTNTRIMAKGLCTTHYKRAYRHGDPHARVNRRAPDGATPAERLAYIGHDERVVVEALGPCHEWRGLRDDKGYGRLWNGERVEFAHRMAYRLHHGDLDPDADLMHQCDNPPCINAEHMLTGDDALNAQEKVARGRSLNGELHHWHKLTDEQVQAIRDDYTGEWGQQTRLAEQYGVAPSYISVLVRGLARPKATNWRPGYEHPVTVGAGG